MTKRQRILLIVMGLLLLVFVFRGQIFGGKAKLTAARGVSLRDPCPGDDVIFDAPSGRCIPLVEEVVTQADLERMLN